MNNEKNSINNQLRVIEISFNNSLNRAEVSAFRGAIIEKVGRSNILFNHHFDDKRYLYKYPLIQYKSIRRRAAIVCIGEGVDEIYKLFSSSSWVLSVRDRVIDLSIDDLKLYTHHLAIANSTTNYLLTNWLALNEKNYPKYRNLQSELDRIEMLESILIGNLLSFARGVEWFIEEEIKVRINSIDEEKLIRYKGNSLLGFKVKFSSNIKIPNYIGLGKGASHGYGIVSKQFNS